MKMSRLPMGRLDLFKVFDTILTGRRSGQKLQCFHGKPMANLNLTILNFTQFVNRIVKILGRRLYSPSLKDIAWLEDAQLIFVIFRRSVYTSDFCRGNSMQFLSRLSRNFKIARVNCDFQWNCRRDIAGVSNMLETCCNFSATNIASSCRGKNRLCKLAFTFVSKFG